jgi:hypothetical protein
MPKHNKCTPVEKRCSTAGIFSALAVLAAGTVGVYFGRQYFAGVCQKTGKDSSSFVESLLQRNLSTGNLSTVITADLPDQLAVDGSIQIPDYTDPVPISTHLNVHVPDTVPFSIGPLTKTGEELIKLLLGQEAVDLMRSFPQQAATACEEYSGYAVIAIGAIITLSLLWQISIVFGFGSKICAHDKYIKKHEDFKLEEVVVKDSVIKHRKQ